MCRAFGSTQSRSRVYWNARSEPRYSRPWGEIVAGREYRSSVFPARINEENRGIESEFYQKVSRCAALDSNEFLMQSGEFRRTSKSPTRLFAIRSSSCFGRVATSTQIVILPTA